MSESAVPAGVKPHITHFDDCGCRSAEYEKRITDLTRQLAEALCALDTAGVTVAQHKEFACGQCAMLALRTEERDSYKLCAENATKAVESLKADNALLRRQVEALCDNLEGGSLGYEGPSMDASEWREWSLEQARKEVEP